MPNKNKIEKKQLPKPVLATSGSKGINDDMLNKSGYYGNSGNTFNSDTFEGDNVSRFPSEIRNPTLNPEMFFLPKFLSNDGSPNIELNTWWDHYYRFHPLISNLLNLHSTLPISRFGLVGINDNTILKEYEEIAEDLKIFEMSINMLHSYFLRGEYALYARWNDDIKSFNNLKLIDTNYINVTGHYMLFSDKNEDTEVYEYQPDEYLQALVNTDNEVYQKLVDDFLDPEIKEAIENNLTIMINSFQLSFERRTVNTWDLRGTSILCNILKTLLLEDKLREFQYANAQANATPIYLWNVGDSEYVADEQMILATQALVQNLAYDPNKNIIANHLLKLNVIGAAGQTQNMHQDFEYIENLILTALWGNKAFTHSEGITYNSSSTAMRVLMGRYIPIRNGLENVFYRKIFLPIAMARGYYKRSTAELKHGIRASKSYKDLVIPGFDWRHKQSLMDDANVRSMLMQLMDKGKIPMKTICDSMDLDYDYTMKWLEKETNTIFDPYLTGIKKTLLDSAAAGTLKDKGNGMMKRIMDAASEWANVIFGKSPNVETIDKNKDDDKDNKEDKKDKEEIGKLNKVFESEGKESIENIIRKHASNVEKQLKESKKFKTVYSSNDIIIQSLTDNYFDKEFINIAKEQAYDLKILLAKKGLEYINDKTGVSNENKKDTIQSYVNSVLSYNKEEYRKRLRMISELAVDKIDSSINKEAIQYYVDFDKYDLTHSIEDLEVSDKNVLKTYWDTINPGIQIQSILNLVNVYRQKQIENWVKQGVKYFYVNGKREDVNNFKFEITDRLVPDFEYKIKKNLKISKNFTAINLPVELIDSIRDLDKRFRLIGSLNLENETFETIDSSVKMYYLGYLYDNLNNYDEVINLESKYSEGEEDEKKFFINKGMKYLDNEKLNVELKDYFKNLYI